MTRAQRIALAVKGYMLDLIIAFCEDVCLLTGHVHGCWLLNSRRSPLTVLHNWALFQRWDDPGPRHTQCSVCHFDRNDYIHRDDWSKDMDRYFAMGEESGREDALKSLVRVSTAYTYSSGGACNTFTWNSPCS